MRQKEMMLAMLEDVVKHFSKDPKALRSVNDMKCLYYPPKDKPKCIGCAIGMYLPYRVAKKLDGCGEGYSATTISSVINERPEGIPKWIKELPIAFLGDIQVLHDMAENWDNSGLSYMGREIVKEIKKQIKSNHYGN